MLKGISDPPPPQKWKKTFRVLIFKGFLENLKSIYSVSTTSKIKFIFLFVFLVN